MAMAPCVLLLDYDSRSIGQVRSALRSAGLEVRLALDGVSGIREFHSQRPDLVLVQDLLPRKHGTEVCRDLKRTAAGRRTPVLLIAPEKHTRRTDLLNTGCDGFVTKPIDQGMLLERVRTYLGIEKPKIVPKEDNGASASRRLTPENASQNLDWIPLEIAGAIEEEDIDAALGMMGWGDEPEQLGAAAGSEAQARQSKARKRAPRKSKATKAKSAKKRSSKKAATRKKASTRNEKKKTASSGPKRKTAKKKTTRKKSTRKKVAKKTSVKKKATRRKKPAQDADE
jgi:CheY-like chemotaxis protein